MSPHNSTHRMLLVDDDYAFRWALAVQLQRDDVEVDVAENGREAFEMLKDPARYCCILLDLKLPDTSGTDILAHVARANSTVPVVIISGHKDALDDVKSHNGWQSVRHAVLKPVDVAQFAKLALRSCSHQPSQG